VILALAATALVTAGLVIGRPDQGGRQRTTSPFGTSTTSVPRTTGTTTTVPVPTTTTDAGQLPQTAALPTATGPAFTGAMAALWGGVSTGDAQEALAAFFPEEAYVQLKTVPDAQVDFTGRLVTEFEEDVAAAHQLLGADAPAATLVGVDVDAAYAHWVPVGVCSNDVGYYEVPNARLVYSINGRVASFGIASMISWRGEWYVVHLGAILRSGAGGEIDDPQSGPGSPIYSPTC
jgi:hypothetical protein